MAVLLPGWFKRANRSFLVAGLNTVRSDPRCVQVNGVISGKKKGRTRVDFIGLFKETGAAARSAWTGDNNLPKTLRLFHAGDPVAFPVSRFWVKAETEQRCSAVCKSSGDHLVANSQKENKTMKKLALTISLVLALTVFSFAAIQISVSGIGVGFSSDQATADQSADQQATGNLQMECMAGQIVSSFKSGDQCANLGDDNNPNYMCTVTYVGSCRVGRWAMGERALAVEPYGINGRSISIPSSHLFCLESIRYLRSGLFSVFRPFFLFVSLSTGFESGATTLALSMDAWFFSESVTPFSNQDRVLRWGRWQQIWWLSPWQKNRMEAVHEIA
jgi:hypothetical protein